MSENTASNATASRKRARSSRTSCSTSAPHEAFRRRHELLRQGDLLRAGRGRRELPNPQGEAFACGRIGLRQNHRRQDAGEPAEAHVGQNRLRRQRADGDEAGRAQAVLQRHPADLPGSLRVAQPAHAHRRHHRRAHHHEQHPAERPGGGSRERAVRARGPGELHAQPLPPRVLGRPAPARGHRARPGREPEAHRVRRAGVGIGRVHPSAGVEPAGRA